MHLHRALWRVNQAGSTSSIDMALGIVWQMVTEGAVLGIEASQVVPRVTGLR